jgi:secondary thiamine-phosphate synthase enzyme
VIETLTVYTRARAQLLDITAEVQTALHRLASSQSDGICLVSVPHTTAGLLINENADPSVGRDLLATLDRLVPWAGDYIHSEGNAAAHVKATLVGSSVSLPVEAGQLLLGTWQGIYLAEFDGPRRRQVHIKFVAE